jgi:hypothetical protein
MVVAVCRPQALANWACALALALLIFSVTCRVQIGIRLILPLVVLAIIGLAAGAAKVASSGISVRSLFVSSFVATGIVWTAISSLCVQPNGLCYVNELWGGTEKGYLRLSDSNYDWGQGLPELERWREAHSAADLDVWYFGTDPAIKTLPLHEIPLHILPIRQPDDVPCFINGRYVAVSTSLLYGRATDTEAYYNALAFLRRYQPIARTTTFFIYDFTSAARMNWHSRQTREKCEDGQGRRRWPREAALAIFELP